MLNGGNRSDIVETGPGRTAAPDSWRSNDGLVWTIEAETSDRLLSIDTTNTAGLGAISGQ